MTANRIKPKRDCIEILFSQLKQQPAASSREEAHNLISELLGKIEDKYSGLKEDLRANNDRMRFWSLDPGMWANLSGDPASISLKGGMSGQLYNDGSIKI